MELISSKSCWLEMMQKRLAKLVEMLYDLQM